MTHKEKVDHFVEEMKSKGVRTWDSAPPISRLLWKLGFEVPPLMFIDSKVSGIISGILFGISFELLSLVPLFGTPRQFSIYTFIIEGLIVGSLFGYVMATWYKHQYKKYNLPDWKDYLKQS